MLACSETAVGLARREGGGALPRYEGVVAAAGYLRAVRGEAGEAAGPVVARMSARW